MTSCGTSCSAGCVRLTVADAYWIYTNISRGTIVEFYSSDNPGPLGKPSTKTISNKVECRNWDPTDSDTNNPWHTYVEPEVTVETESYIDNNSQEEHSNNITNETDYQDNWTVELP